MKYLTNAEREQYINISRPDSFFELLQCGYTPANPAYEIYRYKNSLSVFEYVISGTGYIDSDSGRKTVRAGDFYLLRPGFIGHYYPDPDDPYQKIWANVRGSMIDRLTELCGITSPVTVMSCRDSKIYDDLRAICEIFAAFEGDEFSEPVRQSSIRIADILTIVRNELDTNEREVRSDAVRIRDYLEIHLCDDINLGMIADAMYMHEATVIRVFKECFGITPMKYLSSIRIEAAKRMLRDRIPLSSIAGMLKFSDTSYFSLCFRKETGMSPLQYADLAAKEKTPGDAQGLNR